MEEIDERPHLGNRDGARGRDQKSPHRSPEFSMRQVSAHAGDEDRLEKVDLSTQGQELGSPHCVLDSHVVGGTEEDVLHSARHGKWKFERPEARTSGVCYIPSPLGLAERIVGGVPGRGEKSGNRVSPHEVLG
jgi:hypothetical protein